MMTEKKNGKATWPIGIYLIVSVYGAFVMAMPGLDLIPPRPLLIQAAVFLFLMWCRLVWAIWKSEDRSSSTLYIALMIILPFIMRPIGDVMLSVHDCFVR